MKNAVLRLTLFALAGALVWGCAETSPTVSTTPTSIGGEATIFCGKCGQTKGTAECCAENAEHCEGCDLHKGSALCCKISAEFAGKDICAACGQTAGTDHACSTGAETCEKCQFEKGSPACCKGLTAAKTNETTDATDATES